MDEDDKWDETESRTAQDPKTEPINYTRFSGENNLITAFFIFWEAHTHSLVFSELTCIFSLRKDDESSEER